MTVTPSDREHLAADYALGLLDGAELAEARALERSDAAFRAEVAAWLGRLAPMLDEVEAVKPPATALAAIERHIAPPAPSNVIDINRRLNRWKAFAATASAIAASLALVLVTRPPNQVAPVAPPAAPMVAAIGGEQGAAMIASWSADSRSLVVIPAKAVPAPAGRTHELWLIAADGVPKSMGVMPDGTMRMTVPMPMAARLADGVTLAVSEEPLGGSPTGLPTGPVIATGKLQRA